MIERVLINADRMPVVPKVQPSPDGKRPGKEYCPTCGALAFGYDQCVYCGQRFVRGSSGKETRHD